MFSSRNILLKISLCILLIAIATNSILKWCWSSHGIIDTPQTQYDFIIVGGGSAGCVIARRLWEQTNLSILVIEPGTTSPWISAIPLLAPALQGYTADWAYKTVQQKKSQYGLNNQQSAWPRGKVLGGSSVINYMVHTWGSRSDFDNLWSSAGPDWDFESVRWYFQKAESFQRIPGTPVSDMRGKGGPMPVLEFDPLESSLARAFLNGAESLGIKIGDLNGELENGAMPIQSNTWNGWRVSAFDAYLDPIMEASNIHLLANTLAIKVVVKDERAISVIAVNIYSGKTFQIEAKKEIILSAGVIGTPQLLMLSGIGPKEHLQQVNIPVIADLPGVGCNLQDHLNVPLYFHVTEPVSITTRKVRSARDVWKYLTKGKGYLANSGVEAIARVPIPGNNSTQSKLYFMLFNLGSINEGIFTSIANFKKDAFLETFPDTKNDSKEGFIILASCTHPTSIGTVRLSSANPLEPPLIDPNYLSEPEDIKCLTKAMKMGARLGVTKQLREFGSRLHLPGYNACSEFNQSLEDDRYLECWLKMSGITAYHPVGTCAMGRKDDPMAVLDHRLRVKGIKSLRVVDASAFPYLTSGNPHAVVLMLAEKAAEIILEDEKTKNDKKEHFN